MAAPTSSSNTGRELSPEINVNCVMQRKGESVAGTGNLTTTASTSRTNRPKKSGKGGMEDSKRRFAPRRIIAPNDLIVDTKLGKVLLPKQEGAVVLKKEEVDEQENPDQVMERVIKSEETDVGPDSADAEVPSASIPESGTSAEAEVNPELQELKRRVVSLEEKVKSLEEELIFREEGTQSLKTTVGELGSQVQNLNKVLVELLGRQLPLMASSAPKENVPENKEEDLQFRKETVDRVVPNDLHDGVRKKDGARCPPKKVSRPENKEMTYVSGRDSAADRVIQQTVASSGVTLPSVTPKKPEIPPGPTADLTLACTQFPSDRHRHKLTLKNGLVAHITSKHKTHAKRFSCDWEGCDKILKSRKGLTLHVNISHKGIRYQCAHCPNYFRSGSDLKHHEKVHMTGQPLLKCPICGAEVLSEISLRGHISSRHFQLLPKRKKAEKPGSQSKRSKLAPSVRPKSPPKRKKWTCSKCPEDFNCVATLRYHVRTAHPSNGHPVGEKLTGN